MPYATAEQRAEYQRKYRQRTAAKRAAARPDYDRARHANRRAKALGIEGRITVADVRTIMAAGKCAYCGSPEQLRLDHVVPMARGGANDPENIVCACSPCNSRKGRKKNQGTWAERHECCVSCGTTERQHIARGRCSPCYQQAARKDEWETTDRRGG